MPILITGGRVIDPPGVDAVLDVLVDGGRIAAVGPRERLADLPAARRPPAGDLRVMDAAGKLVCPGLIDLHVHLREPGFEHKETIESGCRAAVAGGFTAVCCMANTEPVNDTPEVTRAILERARRAGLARVLPVAAVTRGLAGRELADLEALRQAGAVAFSDDGHQVAEDELMRQALIRAGRLGAPVIAHCETPGAAAQVCVNAGPAAAALGVTGVDNASESRMVARDIALSRETGGRLHVAHVSTRQSVDALRAARQDGAPVTAETAPHYFALTDEAVGRIGTNAKMNPPLRSEEDRRAVCRGLAEGTIDAIATDHAPHSPQEKARPFAQAPNGVIGLETALGLGLKLVEEGLLPLAGLIACFTEAPARILGIDYGLRAGLPADITIIDCERQYIVDPDKFRSKSRNTPFAGWRLKGCAAMTIVGGRIVYEAD